MAAELIEGNETSEDISGEVETEFLCDTDMLLIELENSQFGLFELPYNHKKHQVFHKFICSSAIIIVRGVRKDGVWSIQSSNQIRSELISKLLEQHREEFSKYLDSLIENDTERKDVEIIVDLVALSASGLIERLNLKQHVDFEPLNTFSNSLREFIYTFRCGSIFIYFPAYFFKETIKNCFGDLEVPKQVRVAYAQGMTYGQYNEETIKSQDAGTKVACTEPCGYMHTASITCCDSVLFKYDHESDTHIFSNAPNLNVLRAAKSWAAQLDGDKRTKLDSILIEQQANASANDIFVYRIDKEKHEISVSFYYLILKIDKENIDLLKLMEEHILQTGKTRELFDENGVIHMFLDAKQKIIDCINDIK